MTASATRYDATSLYSELLNRLWGDGYAEYGPDGPCPWEDDWEAWLGHLFPTQTAAGFAGRHESFWSWAFSIRLGQPSPAFVAIWPRGGGKSESSELAAVALGARGCRKYALYVSATQEAADKHVSDIGAKLESAEIARWYPALGRREVGKYGSSRGWRGSRWHTDAGFVVDSIGLNSTIRGTKIDAKRPDLIILDDVDELTDGPDAVQKKIDIITHSILPSGAPNCVVLFAQNLIHRGSIASRLAGVADELADFLHERIVDGPHKAIDDLVVNKVDGKPVIVSGTPTWEGQSLPICQSAIDNYGLAAFLRESQQDVTQVEGPVYKDIEFSRCAWDQVPWPLVEIEVWVDPAMTDSKSSDAAGIQVDGRSEDGALYRLWSMEQRMLPDEALKLAVAKAVEFKATKVGVETNQGGDLWIPTFRGIIKELEAGTLQLADGTPVVLEPGEPAKAAVPAIPGIRAAQPSTPPVPGQQPPGFLSARPSGGGESKTERQTRMVAAYNTPGRIIHVLGPTTAVLERALKRFPTEPDDLADAAYHSWWSLCGAKREIKWA